MTPDAIWSGRMAKFYWVFTHVIVVIILILRNSTLHKRIFIEHDYFYVVMFFISVVVCTFLYFACCIDPGYLPKNPDGPRVHVRADAPSEESTVHSESGENTASDHHAVDIELGAVLSSDKPAEAHHHENDLHVCTYCNVVQPLRTKHCNDCERCVSRYDHHCFFVGTCVGQQNHLVFWWYLLVQSFVIAWAFVMEMDGFVSTDTISDWFYTNGLILVVTFVLFIMFFLPFGLWLFHTYLILTNQTTWEVSKRNKITYLQEVPDDEFPFDVGFFANIREFFTMKYSKIVWMVPEDINTRPKKFNIWNNKYWSCF